MKNRKACLLVSIFLSMPTGYLSAAAESDGALVDEIVFKEAGDYFGRPSFPEETIHTQEAIAASLNNDSVATNIEWPVTERGKSIIELVTQYTHLNKQLAALVENYARDSNMREQTIKADGRLHSIAIAPDDSNIVAATGNSNKIVMYGPETGTLLNTFNDLNSITSIAFSSDGTRIAFGLSGNEIRIFNAETGQCLKSLGVNGTILALAFSPDNQRIVSGVYEGIVFFWDIETGQRLQTVDVSQRGYSLVRKMAFSPDGNYIASGFYEGAVRIWDIKAGRYVRTLLGGNKAFVESIAFSPNGQYIAFGSRDKNIRIFNAESGELLHTLKGHQDFVTAVAFSPDGHYVISGSHDHTIRVWDISKIINKERVALIKNMEKRETLY